MLFCFVDLETSWAAFMHKLTNNIAQMSRTTENQQQRGRLILSYFSIICKCFVFYLYIKTVCKKI